VYDAPEPGEPPVQYNNTPAMLRGQLVATYAKGAHDRVGYDSRGHAVAASRRLAKPTFASDLTQRYTGYWFQRNLSFDSSNRLQSESTGADVPELLDASGFANITYTYSARNIVKSVGGSFGTLIASTKVDYDGLPIQTVYGDAAATRADFTYDGRRRLDTYKLSRTAPAFWTATAVAPYTKPAVNTVTQTVLSQLKLLNYDLSSNPLAIQDQATPSQWPAGAKPSQKTFTYDSLYRVTNAAYAYKASTAWGNDAQTQPFAFETSIGDSRPIPRSTTTQRMRTQSNTFDWIGTTTATADNANLLFDRSLGAITNEGTRIASAGAGGAVTAKYDDNGNLVDLLVRRTGTCTGNTSKCIQRFSYEWDEVGQLSRARRWDYGTFALSEPVYPDFPTRVADWDMRYMYGGGGRVLKSSTNDAGAVRYSAEVFSTLRLNRTVFENGEYTRTSAANKSVETVYVGGMARVMHVETGMPIRTAADKKHVFFQVGDTLGSTSVVFDKNTSETVEKVTYDAWGRTESDYRPARWSGFREDYRFTEKEEDIEVGLTYFGARYYSSYLGRFVSPDPLQTHAGGGGPNTYAYVSGMLAQATDPFGLETSGKGTPQDPFVFDIYTKDPVTAKPPKPPEVREGQPRKQRNLDELPAYSYWLEQQGAASSAGGVPVVATDEPAHRSLADIVREVYPSLAPRIDATARQDVFVIDVAPVVVGLLTGGTSAAFEEGVTMFHGTDIASARGFLNGAALDPAVAAARNSGGPQGFFLATDVGTAEHFAAARGGPGGVLRYEVSADALTQLRGAGSTFGPIAPGRNGYPIFPGQEFVIRPDTFGLFNNLRASGQIVVLPSRQ
jgi:RHS repeat-associated protein